LIAALIVLYAQALTGGRGGYLAWCTIGLTLGLLRWRGYLVLAPLLLVGILSIFPAVGERALWGIHPDSPTESDEIDLEEFTAGRTTIWPKVIEKSLQAPLFGHGRLSFQRTGLSAWWSAPDGLEAEGATHPHNAYLEMLLDSGMIGLLLVLSLYGYTMTVALSLVSDRRSPVFLAVGGIAVSLILAQLAGSFTGQSFYPREATVGMWCAIGLLLRVSLQRSRTSEPSHQQTRDWHSVAAAYTTFWPGAPVSTPVHRPIRKDAPWWRPERESS
jgi:O-antigen ligase